MTKPKTQTWTVYILKRRPHYVGMVQATDAADAIEKALKQFEISEADKFRLSAQPG